VALSIFVCIEHNFQLEFSSETCFILTHDIFTHLQCHWRSYGDASKRHQSSY
jgi:hypothetical protein